LEGLLEVDGGVLGVVQDALLEAEQLLIDQAFDATGNLQELFEIGIFLMTLNTL
jgi:hypothetical protein